MLFKHTVSIIIDQKQSTFNMVLVILYWIQVYHRNFVITVLLIKHVVIPRRLCNISNSVFHIGKYCIFSINTLTLLWWPTITQASLPMSSIGIVLFLPSLLQQKIPIKVWTMLSHVISLITLWLTEAVKGFSICLSTSTLKDVKNGSMMGIMSNVTLLQLFWNCFWIFWVVDSVLCRDVDPYDLMVKEW